MISNAPLSESANLLSRLDRTPITRRTLGIIVLLMLAWITEAFDIGIVGSAVLTLKKLWHLSPSSVGLLGISSTVGITVGLLFCGRLTDLYGRRRMLIIGLTAFSLFTLAGGLVANFWWVLGCRTLAGLGEGAVFPLPYLMGVELIKSNRRATTVGVQNGVLTASYLLPSLVGAWALSAFPLAVAWRVPFLVGGVPLILAAAMVVWLPESPRWLLTKGRISETRRFVESLEREAGIAPDNAYVNPGTLRALRSELTSRATVRELFAQPYFTRGLLACLFFMATDFIWYPMLTFAPTIFATQGLTPGGALVFLGVMMFVAGLSNLVQGVAADKYGRKPVLGLYTAFAAVGLVLLAFQTSHAMLLIAGALCAIFGLGIYPVNKVYIAEQFPTRLRGLGSSTSEMLARFVTGVPLTYAVPFVLAIGGPRALWLGVAVALVLLALPAMIWGPETAGMSLEEVSSPDLTVRLEAAASPEPA